MKALKSLLAILCLALVLPSMASAACVLVPFRVFSDSGGQFSSGVRNISQCVNGSTLAANVAETVSVPAGARIVLFSSDCSFYAAPGASAAALSTDVTDGTASEQNPAHWALDGTVSQITVISTAACHITYSYYR